MQLRRIRGVGLWFHALLTSALDGFDLSASSFGCFTPGERASIPFGKGLWRPQTRSRHDGKDKISHYYWTLLKTVTSEIWTSGMLML